MGEYAKHNGETIKIGTCEDMYYLRADQRHLVTKEPNSLDVNDEEILSEIRFRFPFPEEDSFGPGEYEDHSKGVSIWGCAMPKGFSHYSVQFTALAGYVTSLPCPEGESASHGLTVHRNGFQGAVKVVQQKFVDGEWWTVCKCGGCGAKFRLDAEMGISLAQHMADTARDYLAKKDEQRAAYWIKMSNRVLDGYRKH